MCVRDSTLCLQKKEFDTAFIRVIRDVSLHLLSLLSTFHQIIDQEVSAALSQCSSVNDQGFKAIPPTRPVESIQNRFNILLYLGDKLGPKHEPVLAWRS